MRSDAYGRHAVRRARSGGQLLLQKKRASEEALKTGLQLLSPISDRATPLLVWARVGHINGDQGWKGSGLRAVSESQSTTHESQVGFSVHPVVEPTGVSTRVREENYERAAL
jgi:hypothetical protein